MIPVHASSDKQQSLSSLCRNIGIKEEDLVSAEQVHGNGIALVSNNHRGQQISKVDALITKEKNLPLSIRTADCAPILIFDPEKEVLALVHAGRKGTEAEIVHKTVRKMLETFNSAPENLIIKIGPCIGKCCYPMDLRDENLRQLLKSGVKKENIETTPECTCCDKDKYFSYRGDGPGTGRNFLVAML